MQSDYEALPCYLADDDAPVGVAAAARVAARHLALLAELGATLEKRGYIDESDLRRARIEAAIAVEFASESMTREGLNFERNFGQLGASILAGFRSANQLSASAQWLAAFADEYERTTLRAA